MKPETVHRICQKIRNERADLTAEERFARSQPDGDTKREIFAMVNFWRRFYNEVEKRISQQQTGVQ